MLAQKLILSFSSKIFVKLLQFIGTIVVARIAGPTVLGTVAYGMAYVSIIGFITDLGMGTAHMKLVSSRGDNEANLNSTFSKIRIGLVALYMLVMVFYYFIQKLIFDFTFPSENHKWVVIISFLSIIIMRINSIPISMFNAKVEQAKQDIPDMIKAVISQSLRVIVVLFGYQAIAITLSSLVAVVLITPVYFYLALKFPFGKFDITLAKKYLAISLPLIVVVAINSFISFGDKLILQHYAGTEQVGIYVAGYRLADFILLIGGSVGLIFFPTFSRLIADNKIDEINKILHRFERFSFVFILPFVFSLFIFGSLIIDFFLGVEYIMSVKVLSIITFALFVYTMSMPYSNIITASNYFGLFAKINVVKGIVFLFVSLILVSDYGFNMGGAGMAISVLVSHMLFAILLVAGAYKLKSDIKVFSAYWVFVFGFIYSLCFYLLYANYLSAISFMIDFILFICYFVMYWFIGYMFGIITKDDFKSLKVLLDISKLKAYIKKEMKN